MAKKKLTEIHRGEEKEKIFYKMVKDGKPKHLYQPVWHYYERTKTQMYKPVEVNATLLAAEFRVDITNRRIKNRTKEAYAKVACPKNDEINAFEDIRDYGAKMFLYYHIEELKSVKEAPIPLEKPKPVLHIPIFAERDQIQTIC